MPTKAELEAQIEKQESANKGFMANLGGRKLWAGIVATAVMALLTQGFSAAPDTALMIVSPLLGFIFGQAGVDAAAALKKK